MTSPFAGCWKMYGAENCSFIADALPIPAPFKCAMKSVRKCEEIHVNGDNVHVNAHCPTFSVPAHSKEINFTFGVEHSQSLPLGKCGKGTVTKESDNKWVAKMAHEGGSCTITREIRNGEMWVTMEGAQGKAIRKFERCTESCSGAAAAQCANKTGCSPFQGTWRLYGSDNFDKFLEAAGVPAPLRCIMNNTCVSETIHVNGDDVHVRICVPEIIVPAHTEEHHFKFGEAHECSLPFVPQGTTATVQKLSESKWQAKVSCKAQGDAVFTREIVNNEMWFTVEAKGKRAVFKFNRPASCSK